MAQPSVTFFCATVGDTVSAVVGDAFGATVGNTVGAVATSDTVGAAVGDLTLLALWLPKLCRLRSVVERQWSMVYI